MPDTDVDLYWSNAGDFVLDSDRSDLRDTSKTNSRDLIQRIQTRLLSTRGDWSGHNIGANLGEFQGLPNNRNTGSKIVTRVYDELVSSGLLTPGELQVDVVPISKDMVALLLEVRPSNTLQAIKLQFTYNTSENKIAQV